MTRYFILAAALAACSGKSGRADSVDAAIPAIDTLKPVTANKPESKSESEPKSKSQPQTQPKLRDSAFPPPRNLPRLDTVKKKPD